MNMALQGEYPLGGQEYYNPPQPANPQQVLSVVETIQPLADFSLIASVPTSIGIVDTVIINGSSLLRGVSIVPIGTGISVLMVIQAGSNTYTIPNRAASTGQAVGISTILNIQYEHPYIILLPQGSVITTYAVATGLGQYIQIFYDIINNNGVS